MQLLSFLTGWEVQPVRTDQGATKTSPPLQALLIEKKENQRLKKTNLEKRSRDINSSEPPADLNIFARMRSYQHIFFDLDHTLWDFEKCSIETLGDLYSATDMASSCPFSATEFLTTFSKVNYALWSQYNVGRIAKETLRQERFKIIFNTLNYVNDELADYLNEAYIKNCSQKGHLIPYAREVLEYLSPRYHLHIITNGFEEIQHIKMKSSGISSYFKEIITSEKAGYKKPEKGMFNFAMNAANTTASRCIMVGDDLEADMVGASNSSIDNIFFNPGKIAVQLKVTHEVACLREIITIL